MISPSVILLSGGLDSAANLAFCCGSDRCELALTADYGQRAAASEIRAATRLCEYYAVNHRVVDLRWLGGLGKSALTDRAIAVPRIEIANLDDASVTAESARAVWVPNRNGVLIQVAAAHAESLGAQRVVVGFNIEEARTFTDNSMEFLQASNAALKFSTQNKVELSCYTGEWTKIRIVQELKKLQRPFPFDLLWSCYNSGQKPCGFCESCQRQKRAFEAAGVVL